MEGGSVKKQLDMFAPSPPVPRLPPEYKTETALLHSTHEHDKVSSNVWLDPSKYWICHGCHTKWLNGDKCRYCK